MLKVLYIVLFTITIGSVNTLTEDNILAIKTAIVPLVAECAKEAGVGQDLMQTVRDSKQLQALDPCLLACFFRKAGLLNDVGIVDVNQALANSIRFVSGDDYEKVTKIAKNCASVNTEAVSDGTKGCARAALLAKCLAQHKDMF